MFDRNEDKAVRDKSAASSIDHTDDDETSSQNTFSRQKQEIFEKFQKFCFENDM